VLPERALISPRVDRIVTLKERKAREADRWDRAVAQLREVTRVCDNFDPDRISETLAAAEDLARNLPDTIVRFRQAIDP